MSRVPSSGWRLGERMGRAAPGGPASLTIVALVWREIEHIRPCFISLRHLVALTGAETLIVLDDEADAATEAEACAVADRVAQSVSELSCAALLKL